MIYESELYHHGVKGMKWGVRKKKVAETTNSDKVRAYRDEMQRRKENAKKARAEYNQAKKSYNTERSKMNETFLRKQLTIEKLGKKKTRVFLMITKKKKGKKSKWHYRIQPRPSITVCFVMPYFEAIFLYAKKSRWR